MAATLTESERYAARWGPLGRALLDFHEGATDARIIVHTDLWHDEITPVAATVIVRADPKEFAEAA